MLTATMAWALVNNSLYLLKQDEQAAVYSLAAVLGWTALMIMAMGLLAFVGDPGPPMP